MALRDGGLEMIGEALGLELGGRGSRGGGEAVEAFVEGYRRLAEKEEREGKGE